MRRFVLGLLMSALPLMAQPRAWNYPAARRDDVVDDYFGTRIADPYRWLENLDSAETRDWVAAENDLTFSFLRTLPERAAFNARLTQYWDYPRVIGPFKEGGRYFYSRNSGLQNQAVLYVQESLTSRPRVVIDPNGLSQDGTVAVTSAVVSHDGRRLAYEIASAGSDWNTIRVRSVDEARDTEDVVRWVKFSDPAWTRDNAGFFYSRYPAPADGDASGATFGELAHQRLYYHRVGTPQSADRLVYERADEPKWFVNGLTTEDGRYLLIVLARGASPETLLSVLDLQDPEHPRFDGRVVPIVDRWAAEYEVVGNRGPTLYVLTNLDAPRKRVVAIDLRSPDRAHWRTVIPEGPDAIDAVSLVGGRFVARTMHDASSRLTVFSEQGKRVGEIGLPGIGTVVTVNGHADDPEFFYNYTSFNTPLTNYRYDLAANRGEPFLPQRCGFDPNDFVTEQVFCTSKDGTRVPLFISHRRDVKVDANTPALLYGYGGFEIAQTPAFSVVNLVWMQEGGIYAQACLRGGSEYGKAWHEAGTKERKQNVFDDFIASAEWLFAHHYTSPAKLVLSGRSNGGLLVGATVNQRPDLCRVAWPAVGVMDMLRFQKFTVGFAWVSDYGSSDDPAGFKYLRAYSPLHNVKPGVKYPAMLITTADHDDRVYPAHSFKYTATLQAEAANAADSGPILIRIETRAGHGPGTPTTKLIDEAADKLAFAAHFLGMKVN